MVAAQRWVLLVVTFAVLFVFGYSSASGRGKDEKARIFQTSDRCVACHNGLVSPSGRDVSIGFDWRATIMANSSRDPYWQASVRRESIDHPESQSEVEDECTICHMPMTRYEAKLEGRKGEFFSHIPFDADKKENAEAVDGVSCSVCHQIENQKLGSRESFVGGFVIEPAGPHTEHHEYGPFDVDAGHQRIMQTSTGGFRPTEAAHIRDSALCGTCHTLYTTARGVGGKVIGTLPEQMPYLEWRHSSYPQRSSCQSCHMPEFPEGTPITAVLGAPRTGARQHTFLGGNFLMLRMFNVHREELSVSALPQELSAAADQTMDFLQSQSARLSIRDIRSGDGRYEFDVVVENLTGHKLPTAYPSRRAWLHVQVKDENGGKLFESGALHPDGSIEGNDNDEDKTRFEPHHREITRPDEVQIYEDILQDEHGGVTTGLLSGVSYLKDNRLLPTGFDKNTADQDIAVVGDAMGDPDFTEAGDVVHFSIPAKASSTFHIEAELWYQPIGYRWAHNLKPYSATEPQRFTNYYEEMAAHTATVLARAEATR
jgi:hypothetical protein